MIDYGYTKELKGPFLNTGGLSRDNFFLKIYYKVVPPLTRCMKPPKNIQKSFITLPGENDFPINCIVLSPANLDKDAPTIISLHGGGFFIGVNPLSVMVGSYFAEKLGCKVFIPEYRTSLEHKFPTPVEDCYSSVKELILNSEKHGVNREKVVLYGDSAGGCLAAAVALMARDRKEFNISFQMLIYPVTDYLMQGDSFKLFPNTTWSTKNNVQMWDTYLGGTVPKNLDYASPLYAKDHKNLPPAYIEPQGIDCLRDDGVLYAKKLKDAGCDVELNIIEGSYHGFELEFKRPFTVNILNKRLAVLKAHFDAKP